MSSFFQPDDKELCHKCGDVDRSVRHGVCDACRGNPIPAVPMPDPATLVSQSEPRQFSGVAASLADILIAPYREYIGR